MYGEDDYDLAGFAVRVAEKSEIIDGSKVVKGRRASGAGFLAVSIQMVIRLSAMFYGLHW